VTACAPIPSTAVPAPVTTFSTKPETYTLVSSSGSGGGSVVDPVWVEKYPYLYGPNAKDPDEGQGDIECNDEISKILIKFTGIGGTFSTWSERHAFIFAAQIGYLHVKSSADVPPVPSFYLKEAHYWNTGIIMGRAAAKLEEKAAQIDWKAIIAAAAAGGFGVQALLKYIFPLLGV